jgi:hypothetical protein
MPYLLRLKVSSFKVADAGLFGIVIARGMFRDNSWIYRISVRGASYCGLPTPSRRRWLGVPLNFNVIVFTARKEIATAVVYLDCTVLVTETEPSVDASISVALSLLLQE